MAKTPRSRLRNALEYAAVRAVEFAVRLLPLGAARGCGRVLGRAFRFVDARHRQAAEANVASALGLGETDARRFVRQVYANVGSTAVEMLLLPHLLRRRPVSDFCRFEGMEHVRAAQALGRGLIIVTGHLGNWELSGITMAAEMGDVLSVARTLDNPLLEAYILRRRQQFGQRIVNRGGALRHVVRHLHDGGIVAMLIDQNQREGGVFVDFFGRPASTTPSPARLALKYDVPVLAAYGQGTGKGFFQLCRVDPPFELVRTGDLEADVAANTAAFTRRIEQFVREHPEQWLWLHDRWRKRPREEKKALKAQRAAQAAATGRHTP